MEIKTKILINSSPEKVWEILTEFKNYKMWNPFIKKIEGELKVGEQLKVIIKAPNAKPMTFKPEVHTLKENQEFSWLGHLLIPGLFDGLHKFELIDNKNKTTTFIHSEQFKGILVPLFKKQLSVNTLNGFELMNDKLKKLIENT